MGGEALEIGLAQALRARRAQPAGADGGEKFGVADEGKRLLDRIGDHQHLALRAARGKDARSPR